MADYRAVCYGCFEDVDIRTQIEASAGDDPCDFCEERGTPTISIVDLTAILHAGIRTSYSRAIDVLPYDKESDSGFGGLTWTTEEILFNMAYGIGTVLSENTSSYAIGANTQSISFDLHGIVSSLKIVFQYDYIPLVETASQMPVNSVGITINAYDADNNLINQGDYDSPITLTDRDNSGITALRSTTVTTVAQSNLFLDYYGGFIRGTAVDATTPSISAANQPYNIFPAGLAFDSHMGQGKIADSAPRRSEHKVSNHSLNRFLQHRLDTDGNIQWDGSFLGDCSVQYTEDCGLVTLALGETLTMPFTWFNMNGFQAYSIDISGGELEVTFNPPTVGPGVNTCVTVYSPPNNGPVSDIMQINASSPPSAPESPLMDIGFGVDGPLTLPPSSYFTKHKDC